MVWEHYKVNRIGKTGINPDGDSDRITEDMQTLECTTSRLKEIYDNDTSTDELNMLFLGTSGIHSWYGDLDDAEKQLKHVGEKDDWGEIIKTPYVTVLVFHPRVCCIQYGNIYIETQDDIEYLRGLCTRTIKAIIASQYGNYEKEFREKHFSKEITGEGILRSWI